MWLEDMSERIESRESIFSEGVIVKLRFRDRLLIRLENLLIVLVNKINYTPFF